MKLHNINRRLDRLDAASSAQTWSSARRHASSNTEHAAAETDTY
jgi:hypothetical protein